MGVLDSMLRYKAQKDAEEQAAWEAPGRVIQQFQAGQQMKQKNLIDSLTTQAALAKQGLVYDQKSNTLRQDESLLNTMSNKGVFTIDAEGNLQQVGSVGSKDKVVQKPLSPDQIGQRTEARNSANLDTPTAEIKNNYSEITNAELSIAKMEELANKISTSGWQGAVDIQTGKVTRGESNPELMQYLKEANANAVSIYRAYTGDTRLSDADAEARAYPLLWNPTEGPKLKEISFARLKDVIGSRKSSYKERYGFSDEESVTGTSSSGGSAVGKTSSGNSFKRKS